MEGPMGLRLVLSVVMTVVSLATSAAAAEPASAPPSAAQKRAIREACLADLKIVCAGVRRGEGRIAACAKANFERLSPPCQSALKAAQPGG